LIPAAQALNYYFIIITHVLYFIQKITKTILIKNPQPAANNYISYLQAAADNLAVCFYDTAFFIFYSGFYAFYCLGLSQQRLHIQDIALIPNRILIDLVYTFL